MPFAGSKPTQPRSGTFASAQAWPGILLDDAVGTEEVAGDVAGRNAEMAGGGDEDMGEVLADPAPQREGLPGGRRDMGRLGVEGRLAVHAVEQTVQGREGIGRDVAGDIGRELGDRRRRRR